MTDTSARLKGIDIIRHRRNGEDLVSLYFPREIRSMELTAEEATELTAEINRLAQLSREVSSDVSS